ncbi:CoA activase, partial [candidate division KSB1 bacterium]|nr:CoA activase [candidate division KSB1 bacterium]
KGKEIIPPVAFVGGVAANKGILQAVIDIFQFQANQCFVPVYKFWFEAIGSACKSLEMKDGIRTAELQRVISDLSDKTAFASKHVGNPDINFTTTAISSDKVILLRDRVKRYQFIGDNKVPCYLGVDIGSVSTKLVLIDENDELIYEIYTRTNARPIEVVAEGLDKIGWELGDRIQVKGVGTTGSGRELIGVLIGADTIRDEITAHKTGAMNISEKLTHKNVDTIFDIGGQDSKFIAIENGVVVDFTMNEACAAGTGSFLEEQAEKLGINIYNEFSDLALKSDQPVRLGERCTVFMEKDIIPYIQAGVPKMDIAAGLAYSIVYNYLNRVVRGRKIGNTIYFQGGTAYNDSVAGAFATILNKEIIVPPYNGVIGAIGAAILAKETIAGQRATTSFRGFSIGSIDYSLKNFTCKGCSNFCDIQEFTVEGKKTYWGNKCSERFKQNVRATRRPCIGDLIDYRHQLLDEYAHDDDLGRPSVGYIRSMYYYDQYPFWSAYLHELGYRIVLSDKTNRKIINDGVESLISEPCFPISAAHGHVRNLMEKKVDFVLIPNVIDTETSIKNTYSFLCPWGQVLCFFIQNNPKFESLGDRLLMPNLRFYHGRDYIRKRLELLADRLGHSRRRNRLAVAAAFESLDDYRMKLASKGKSILTQLNECGEKAIILLGRPYNIYDAAINLNIPDKLREHYGINVLPFDYLSVDDIDIADINDNMYWNYGRKILQAAKFVRNKPKFDLIYITNFKCGPDSYVKHYCSEAAQKPLLMLQFDGHGNDAGALTRCEAYLDSKGFLK